MSPHNLGDSSSWPLQAGAGDTEPEPDADAEPDPDPDPDGVPEPDAASKRFASLASFAACSSTKMSMRLLMPIR